MKILLVDVGNTTSDFRTFDQETKTFIKLMRPLSKDPLTRDPQALKAQLDLHGYAFKAIVYVSVVPDLNNTIRDLGHLLNIPIFSARQNFTVHPEFFHLDNLGELGADFIANFYGYISSYSHKNAAIISLGTATTIFVIQDSRFIGTSISPGLKFSLDALLANAALLKSMDYQISHKSLATNTYEAINIGTINGHYYMIRGLIEQIKKTHKIETIIFTGGNSTYYPLLCKQDHIIIDEELIFKGLMKMYLSVMEDTRCK